MKFFITFFVTFFVVTKMRKHIVQTNYIGKRNVANNMDTCSTLVDGLKIRSL